MIMINTIIFDLDGTLLYTLQDLCDSTNYTLREFNMPERTIDEVKSFVGNGVKNLIRRAAARETSEETIEEMFSCFKAHYDIHCMDKTKEYDGITDVLETLHERGYKLAIVSNKVDSAVKELNKEFFSKYITTAIGEKKGVRRKPAPDTVNEAMKELGVTPEEVIYVGDSDVDIATAGNAGVPVISVLWGFRERDFLEKCGATTFVEQPLELLDLFQPLNS